MAPDEPSSPRRRSSPPAAAQAVSPPATLSERIEHERTELMQIQAMVKCLNDVLLYADDDDSPMHADVAHVIASLLDASIARLEVVRRRVAELEALAAEIAADPATRHPHQVRETRATYLC